MVTLVRGCKGGMLGAIGYVVLLRSAVQCSAQLVADMALHRSYCVVPSAAAAQIESVMTKVTNLSH